MLSCTSADAKQKYLTALNRPAAQTEADLARLFGCEWNANPVYAECNDIRRSGVSLELHLFPIGGVIERLSIRVRLSGLTPEQQMRSDQTVVDLVRYFTAPWPARRRWAELVVAESHTTRAAATLELGGLILSSTYLNPSAGELLFVDIRRK